MPEKPSTVATYAISASLAALALGYVFGPSIFPDDGLLSRDDGQKRFAVGLSNPANDCFINSVLQAFAGLRTLKSHLRQIEADLPPRHKDGPTGSASRRLQDGVVSLALQSKLDQLNGSSASKKTVSAVDFIKVLEFAFETSISRRQQDAQEFLQVVAQRLEEEYHALCKSRNAPDDEKPEIEGSSTAASPDPAASAAMDTSSTNKAKRAFPLEGFLESQIECLRCQYKPKPKASSFVTLTLNVPQKNSTTIDECLDGLFKVETIDGFKCDRCQVEYALRAKERDLKTMSSPSAESEELELDIEFLREAYKDPEILEQKPELRGPETAPKQRISKHSRISVYPAALALHLSRSIFSATSLSTKNAAKVEFPEKLSLGFPNKRTYRLACVVTHRGGHNSGHYETFRRQFDEHDEGHDATTSSTAGGDNGDNIDNEKQTPDVAQNNRDHNDSAAGRSHSSEKQEKSTSRGSVRRPSKWWCISDAKIRQCNTSEVLKMQKEAYLLFYELQQKAS